ncbi:putative multiprotein bridging factor mediates GCN4-dependent transcriptional activation [Mycosarcoma maydis]|uniref:Multiprotein bridging factor mediates GCN4-dependent transcriptional activation n=1 Tax=Mycosarcoma maydis TaxID=5270 RepID=A0A0D1CIA6_MYCMD|nr:putative multiprotein bridging factor mediates GCN4-dependent transcriptional activation [Ustilago maydis 521]KIS66693.1 putative multiprotein bridging factor mediates GCN4-dependent transcriptional activation [Ustilago maydis 521]|eukprot:XP_011391737.1 putative multiprotein bridging factor mediates GCN4-dependent transcriptional activation [Ustilago maydis 521]
MSNTDWDSKTVIGRGVRAGGTGTGSNAPSAYDRAKQVGAITENDRKVTAGTNKAHLGTDHQRIAKLDRENEVAPPPKVAPTVGKTIAQKRQEKALTQKDLATKINEKPQVVQDYESGKAIPNPQILAKLERALAVKLRGKDIGSPLAGPKKK